MRFTFKKRSEWKNVSEGFHKGQIVGRTSVAEVVNPSTGVSYQGFRYIIEIDGEWVDDKKKDKRVTIMTKNMRVSSLHPKSNLYKFATAALGEPATEENLTDPDNLFGRWVSVSVVHTTDTQGKVWANVDSVNKCAPILKWSPTYNFDPSTIKDAPIDSDYEEIVSVDPTEMKKKIKKLFDKKR